ncbi:MAG: filamentous hemagglutinin N-terminal domain-containing protein [Planctomycetota bacterium]|jgi:filamentous hemagglutinin family protein
MQKVRKISKKYYLRQIMACWLVCFMVFGLPVQIAMATPSNPNVVAGTAGVGQSGNTTTVNMGTAQAVINWDSLNTSSSEILQFLKAGGSFAVLNRVIQGGATQFDGSLFGNQGHIIIVNPHGIVFGPTALVQSYKFTASALDIADADFMNGIYKFDGGGIGEVANYGNISAEQVALIGKKILNAGTIRSSGGYTIMAVGDSVFLGNDGSDVVVEVSAVTIPDNPPMEGMGDVINEGTIEAAGGKIVLAAGDTFSRAVEGLDGLSVAVESGSGRVGQFGTLNADGVEGDGGSITLTAGEVVALGDESLTTANAGTNGDGGEIIVYSPETALFRSGAQIEAKGGSESGNGGFVEVSGKEHVEIFGSVDASATDGFGGLFFIDPFDITIQDTAPGSLDPLVPDFIANADSSTVSDDVIEGQLDSGTSVLIRTADALIEPSESGTITQNVQIDKTMGGAATLTYDAAGDIILNSGIVSTAGELNVDLRANSVTGGTPSGTGSVSVGAPVTTNGGSFSSSGVDFANAGGVITTGGGSIAINHSGGVTLAADLDAGGGLMSGTSTSIDVASNLAQIQDGIDVAASGATVSVSAGTYTENLSVNKSSITLMSKPGESVTLTPGSGVGVNIQGGADSFVLGGADGEGLTINSGTGTTFLVQLENAPQDVEISWNDIDTTGNASMGVSVEAAGAIGLNINNNTFTADTGDGAIWGKALITDLQITDNTFTGPGLGISSSAIMLRGVAETTESVIADNTIDGFNYGIGIFNGTAATPTDGLDILRNDVLNCTMGLWLRQYPVDDGTLQNVTVQANTLAGNTTGIEIGDTDIDADSISITNNFFLNNTVGIDSKHNTESATIYENSFTGNTTAVSNSGALAMLDAEGNWWGDATGPYNLTTNPSALGDAVSDNVDYSPWLGIGTDSEPGTAGFQMQSPMTWWTNDVIQAAIDAASPGDSVSVAAKTYIENVNVNKGLAALYFVGASASEIDGELKLSNDSDNWDNEVLGIYTINQDLTLASIVDEGTHGLTISSGIGTTYLNDGASVGDDLALLSNTQVGANKILSSGGNLTLAPTKTIVGQGSLTINSDENILLGTTIADPTTGIGGNVVANGDLTMDAGDSIYAHGMLATTAPAAGSGNINLRASNTTIHLYGNVYADVADDGDILIWNTSEVSDGVMLAAGKNIFALQQMTALGDLTMLAVGGAIESTSVFMSANNKLLSLNQHDDLNMEQALHNVLNSGNTNLSATSTAGSVTSRKADVWKSIQASANTFINLNDADSGGDITTGALSALNFDVLVTSNSGKVFSNGPIIAGRDVKLTAAVETPDSISLNFGLLSPDIQAGRDIWLNSNTHAAAGVDLKAGQDVRVGWDDIDKEYEAKTLTGEGALSVVANRHITLGGDVRAGTVVAGDLVLWADKDDVGVPGGDMTALHDIINENGSIDIYASDSTIILEGDKVEASANITLHDNTVLNGTDAHANQRIEATIGKVITDDGVNVDKSTPGSVDFSGGSGIELGGNVTASGMTDADTMTFENDVTANGTDDQMFDAGAGTLTVNDNKNVAKTTAGTLTLGGDTALNLGGNVLATVSGGNLVFDDDVTANRTTASGDQTFYAQGGTLTANASVHKTTAGNLNIAASEDVEVVGAVTVDGGDLAVISDNQNIHIGGQVDSLAGNVLMGAAGNITLDAAAQAAGYMYLEADSDVSGSGDLTTDSLTSGSYLAASGDDITINGAAQSGTDLMAGALWMRLIADSDLDGEGDLLAKDTLTSPSYLEAYGDDITLEAPARFGGYILLRADNIGDGSGDLTTNSLSSSSWMKAYGNNITIGALAHLKLIVLTTA